jgi:hypothetical protein
VLRSAKEFGHIDDEDLIREGEFITKKVRKQQNPEERESGNFYPNTTFNPNPNLNPNRKTMTA